MAKFRNGPLKSPWSKSTGTCSTVGRLRTPQAFFVQNRVQQAGKAHSNLKQTTCTYWPACKRPGGIRQYARTYVP